MTLKLTPIEAKQRVNSEIISICSEISLSLSRLDQDVSKIDIIKRDLYEVLMSLLLEIKKLLQNVQGGTNKLYENLQAFEFMLNRKLGEIQTYFTLENYNSNRELFEKILNQYQIDIAKLNRDTFEKVF